MDDWKKVTSFMKLPSPNTAGKLKDMLDSHKPTYQNSDALPNSVSFLLYAMNRSFKV